MLHLSKWRMQPGSVQEVGCKNQRQKVDITQVRGKKGVSPS